MSLTFTIEETRPTIFGEDLRYISSIFLINVKLCCYLSFKQLPREKWKHFLTLHLQVHVHLDIESAVNQSHCSTLSYMPYVTGSKNSVGKKAIVIKYHVKHITRNQEISLDTLYKDSACRIAIVWKWKIRFYLHSKTWQQKEKRMFMSTFTTAFRWGWNFLPICGVFVGIPEWYEGKIGAWGGSKCLVKTMLITFCDFASIFGGYMQTCSISFGSREIPVRFEETMRNVFECLLMSTSIACVMGDVCF